MILSDKDITELVVNYSENGLKRPLIEPFKESQLQGASYDINISNIIYRFKNDFKTIDIDDQSIIDSIYEETDISFGYTLKPGEYILVTINENVNLTSTVIAHIRPRTKLTRLGLILSDQHCNPTYTGILQLGLLNATPYAIKIKPGLTIGQFVFEELKSEPTISRLYENKKDATYNNEKTFIGSKIGEEKDKRISAFEDLLKGFLNE